LRAASFRIAPAAPMPLRISIRSPVTGKELLVLTETPDGKLDVQGDEANWTEAAKQFIVGLTSVARQTRGY
jgi:hypothetical protein